MCIYVICPLEQVAEDSKTVADMYEREALDAHRQAEDAREDANNLERTLECLMSEHLLGERLRVLEADSKKMKEHNQELQEKLVILRQVRLS